jgi:DNA-binding NtrC family response regulator
MDTVEIAQPESALASRAPEAYDLASRSASRLLITVATQRAGEMLARRIHEASVRAAFPFVRMWAGGFPTEPRTLRKTCSNLLDAAAGGSMFISNVEEMPPIVQNLIVDLLAELECARAPSAGIRLVSATTASLLDRVAAGTFSAQLFYRLNTIHLTPGDGTAQRLAHLKSGEGESERVGRFRAGRSPRGRPPAARSSASD